MGLDEAVSVLEDLGFYLAPSSVFLGVTAPMERADYVVLGVPFDRTSSYRAGSRHAPQSIRQASQNIETMSLRSGVELEEVKIHDAGDLAPAVTADEAVQNVKTVTGRLIRLGKTPVLLGGEHTITLGAVQAMPEGTGVISFDAHLDLRDEYLGEKVCHATVMRRVAEQIGPGRLIQVGTRAVSRAEYDYAKEAEIIVYESRLLNGKDGASYIDEMAARSREFKTLYISIDMDVLDPAYAPGVGNPEPDGLSTHTLLEALAGVCGQAVTGLDLVEVNPLLDQGQSSITAAKTIFEAIAAIELARREIR